MALTVLPHFSEARVAGADGSYTDQIVVELVNGQASQYRQLDHDLGRIPDWVRVVPLAIDEAPTAAFVKPIAKGVVNPTSGRFEWQDTVAPGSVDLTQSIIVAVYNPDSDPDKKAYFLIELGITHSAVK